MVAIHGGTVASGKSLNQWAAEARARCPCTASLKPLPRPAPGSQTAPGIDSCPSPPTTSSSRGLAEASRCSQACSWGVRMVRAPGTARGVGAAIEVIEFFYYGCPVCYESQPYIARWLERAGADVSLRRVPAASFESAENFALTYYALDATGDLAQLHGAVYENHHFDDQRLSEEKNLLDWLERNGVDAEAFRQVRNSAQNRARVAEGRRIFELYNVRAVPAFAVDGRYVTSARLAGDVKEMMDVVAYPVSRAREERLKK